MGATGSVMPSTRSTFDNRGLPGVSSAIRSTNIHRQRVCKGWCRNHRRFIPSICRFWCQASALEDLLPDRSYVFFSHDKGPTGNMDLLDALLEKNIRLFDYETITKGGSRNSPRLVAFGGFAGRAGMVSALRGLGERMLCLGYSTPFLNIGSAYMYPSLIDAKHAVRAIGDRIQNSGLPQDFSPLVFAFTGNGNVSKGAQEVFRELPHEWVRLMT